MGTSLIWLIRKNHVARRCRGASPRPRPEGASRASTSTSKHLHVEIHDAAQSFVLCHGGPRARPGLAQPIGRVVDFGVVEIGDGGVESPVESPVFVIATAEAPE